MQRKPARVLACLALLTVTSAACGGGGNRAAGGAVEASTAETADAPTITLKLVAFRPAEIRVARGRTLTWVQDDVTTHTVTSGRVEKRGGTVTTQPDGIFDSGNLAQGQSFEFTFDQPGDFPFFCSIHPATMTGVVHVA